MDGSADRAINFGPFRLDPAAGSLVRYDDAGASVPVALGARALAVLCALASRSGELVVKQAIMDAVWPDTTVEDKNLTVQVSALRQALEREGGRGDWIQTVPGRGYRFMGPAGSKADAETLSREAAPASVVAGAGRSLLAVSRLKTLAACVVTFMLVGAAGLGWATRSVPLPVAYSPQDRRQSIIVIPFEGSASDVVQDGIAAGLTRDVTDEIAGDPTVAVVPTATAGGYRGKVLDLRKIGRVHNVRFALTGNARRQDGRLIVAATLYTTDDARQIWSQRFDQPDTREASAGIVRRIRANVDQGSMEEDFARALREHPQTLDKRDLMFAASRRTLMQSSKENILGQLALIERALVLDPSYVWALRESARKHANLVTSGFSTDRASDLALAMERVDRALMLAPNEFYTLREKAVVLRAKGHWSGAAALNRQLIERQPLNGYRYQELGSVLMAQGLHTEALENFEAARRLAVETDSVNSIDASVAAALVANGRYAEAMERAHLAIQEFPHGTGLSAETAWLALIAAESASGLEAAAVDDLRRFLSIPRTWRTMAAIRSSPQLAANPKLLAGLLNVRVAAE